MSFRKLLLPAVLVGVFGFVGMQGTATGAPSTGKLTAKDIRTAIVLASGAYKRNGIDPKVASVDVSQFKVRAGSCAKGSDWYTYHVASTYTRGTRCNGKVQRQRTQTRSRQYFQSTMRAILNTILTGYSLDSWGAGRVMSINSNGDVATLYFWNYSDGKPAPGGKMLRVEGSDITVKDIAPGA